MGQERIQKSMIDRINEAMARINTAIPLNPNLRKQQLRMVLSSIKSLTQEEFKTHKMRKAQEELTKLVMKKAQDLITAEVDVDSANTYREIVGEIEECERECDILLNNTDWEYNPRLATRAARELNAKLGDIKRRVGRENRIVDIIKEHEKAIEEILEKAISED